MNNDYAPDIVEVIKMIFRHRFIIGATTLLGAIWGLVYFYVSPKIYKAEAILTIPETISYPISIDSRGNVNALINVFETRYLLKKYWNNNVREGKDIGLGNELIKKVKNIEIEDIRGSNAKFNLVVYFEGDSTAVAHIIDHLFNYLTENEYVKSKYDVEKEVLDSILSEISASLSRAMEIRKTLAKTLTMDRRMNFNPVEIETRIIELKEKYSYYLNIKNKMHSYEYIRKPYTFSNPIKPKIKQIVFMTTFIGFILGIVIISTWDYVKKRK